MQNLLYLVPPFPILPLPTETPNYLWRWYVRFIILCNSFKNYCTTHFHWLQYNVQPVSMNLIGWSSERLDKLFLSYNYTKCTALIGFCYISFVLRLFLLYQEDERAYMSRRPWLMACFLLCPLDVSPCVPYYLALLSYSHRESSGYESKWLANGCEPQSSFDIIPTIDYTTHYEDTFASYLQRIFLQSMKWVRLVFFCRILTVG